MSRPVAGPGRHLLFVYGSLKRGKPSHRLLAGQTFVADARTVGGYRMYELDGYPGMVRDGAQSDFVTGELWSVTDECRRELDRFEGLDVGLYRREPTPLAAPHEACNAEAYVFAQSTAGRKPLGPIW